MARLTTLFITAAAIALAPAHSASAAIVLGQTDTFEGGTLANWTIAIGPVTDPVPGSPLNVPTGGPAGVDDGYMLLTSTGTDGPLSRLAVINTAQWTGNYTAAGATSISMSLNNLGETDLFLRLLFVELAGRPVNVALSTDPIFLAAGSGWTDALFPILPGDLTSPVGSAAGALSNTSVFRLYHSASPTFVRMGNEPIAARLGVDNIRVGGVPEPSTWGMMLMGFAAVGAAMRRRRREAKFLIA